jgi:GT2 family glycosyltransferase
VSIVVPAFRADATLPYTLAALAAQTYPAHLLEVVVVDDDDGPPLDLPELRPENTRVIGAPTSWGRANACRSGAAVAEGEVIHWLDADMVPSTEQVAHQMRWHHTIDHAVVLGHKLFLDPTDLSPVPEVHAAVLDHRLEELFAGRWVDTHEWVEKIWRRTDDLKTAGFRAFHVHVGATASVGRDLYADAGGMDDALRLGEDVELGYRLALKGAVFVAERRATSWHLGRSSLMKHQQQIQRYNAPFIAQRVPDFRKFRQDGGRSYRVPYIEVVVDTDGHGWGQVKYTVDGVLRARPADLRCLLVGRWSELREERRDPLQDALLELRLLREEYGEDHRVALVEKPERTGFPAQFRLHLPVGWRPGESTLDKLTSEMQKRAQGLRSVSLPDGQVARLERTAALERAIRVKEEGEDLDDAVAAVSGTWWSEGHEEGFRHHTDNSSQTRATRPPPASPDSDRASDPAGRIAARLRSSLRRR